MREDENKRFDFRIVVEPRSAGDFGCVRIGGVYRTVEDCISQSEEMIEEINRHIDNVYSCSVEIEDLMGEYDVCSYSYQKLKKSIC